MKKKNLLLEKKEQELRDKEYKIVELKQKLQTMEERHEQEVSFITLKNVKLRNDVALNLACEKM